MVGDVVDDGLTTEFVAASDHVGIAIELERVVIHVVGDLAGVAMHMFERGLGGPTKVSRSWTVVVALALCRCVLRCQRRDPIVDDFHSCVVGAQMTLRYCDLHLAAQRPIAVLGISTGHFALAMIARVLPSIQAPNSGPIWRVTQTGGLVVQSKLTNKIFVPEKICSGI